MPGGRQLEHDLRDSSDLSARLGRPCYSVAVVHLPLQVIGE